MTTTATATATHAGHCPACGYPTAVEPHNPTCPMSIYPLPTARTEETDGECVRS